VTRLSFVLLSILLVFASTGLGSRMASADQHELTPPAGTVRAWIIGASSGKTCGALLSPNGAVLGLDRCTIGQVLARVRGWRTSDEAISLRDAEGAELLLFRRVEDNLYRARDAEEDLELRLMIAVPAR
jgi:hypothetical protein